MADDDDKPGESEQPQRLTLKRRPFGRVGAFFGGLWRRRWVRALGVLALLPIIGYGILWAIFARDLPSTDALLNYQPALPSYVRDVDGNPVQSFARERRIELAYEEFPQRLIDAFISAEDRTFFEHGGIDWPGMAGAVVDYISKTGSGERARGGSTITQQVAKNLLLGDEYSVSRKIREAFLARRIEATLTKQQILTIYLNQIFLGRNAYGVQAAARAYFNKDVSELTTEECAFLAILPRAPSQYDPARSAQSAATALDRRNWVLGQMERNEKISAAERARAQATPLGTIRPGSGEQAIRNAGGYYMEEVRRDLIERFGENAESGANSVYAGGLWVRTAYDPRMQAAAQTALRDGLMRYEAGRGWRDPGIVIETDGDWRARLATAGFGVGYDRWIPAVVLEKSGGSARIGLVDGSTGTLPSSLASMPKRGTGQSAFNALRVGSVIAVERQGDVWALRSTPEIQGGMVVEEVATGRIRAMQGGWDVRGGSFNRATQAMRQPGSTFKPIVYAAAIDGGMTPASIIDDAPFCVNQGGSQKCFRNFSGGYSGPQTMRWGLEQSRNLMTVRAASQVGMDRVVRLARQMGVGDYTATPFLSISLGAGETTVERLTNAYAELANQGRALTPTLIDYVQDRSGRVIFRTDNRCQQMQGCNAADWDGQAMPRPPIVGRQAVDAMTAFQVVGMLEGVVQRGTATILRSLERPIFGKTGTTTGPTNVWFVGGSQDIVAGVYMGFDQPRPMGGYAQGGTLAAPIFRQFAQTAFEGMPVIPFRAPPGIRMVRIDRRTGQRVQGSWPTNDPRAAVIWEAFAPEREPRRTISSDQVTPPPNTIRRAARPAEEAAPQRTRDSDFLQQQGGIY